MKRPPSLRRALAVYAAVAGVVLATSMVLTHGELVLPLDDAYIHFAIARTLADHHAYGLQPGAFSTPSSSLLWPLLLAMARWLGAPLDWSALAIGLVAGAASLVLVEDVLAREGVTLRARSIVLFAIGALVPLVPMALLGMEHSLHIAVVLALVSEVARNDGRSRGRMLLLAALAALAVSLRYESAFVVAALAAWMVFASHAKPAKHAKHDRQSVAALLIGSTVPVALAAAFFASHGAPLLPASVVLKRTHVTLGGMPQLLLHRFMEHPHVPGFLVALAIAWRLDRQGRARIWLFAGGVALVGHATVAQLGWLYRYESHAIAVLLVGLGLALALAELRSARALAVCALVAAALVPAALRASFAHAALPQASRNVAEQQRAIGRFVRELAPRDPVAVNDVGAIAFLGEAPVLDLLGLADLRVARARGMRIDAPLSREQVRRFTEDDHVSLAVLYEPWFHGAIPEAWIPLERWRIRDNRVCAFDTVTFFATRPEAAVELRRALATYRPRLPARVDVLSVPP